jgi:hypothetical protein
MQHKRTRRGIFLGAEIFGPVSWLQRERLGLLSGVAGKRFTSGINTQLLGPARAQLVLGQHSQNRFAHNFFRTALQHHPDRNFFQSAGITTVVTVDLLVDFIAGQLNALGIYHDYVIAAIEMRRVIRFVLADQHARDARSKPPEDHPFGVHHKPILAYLQVFGFPALWYMRLHQSSHTFPSKDKP